MAHFRITPLEKKSICAVYEMYRSNADGTISWFNVEDHYRWGRGFIAEDMECNLPRADEKTIYCKADEGEGECCELDDGVACFFEFSDDLTAEERELIESNYYAGGAGWLFDGDHEWELEDDGIEIIPPVIVELCDEEGNVIREVKLKTLEEKIAEIKPSGDWPQ